MLVHNILGTYPGVQIHCVYSEVPHGAPKLHGQLGGDRTGNTV